MSLDFLNQDPGIILIDQRLDITTSWSSMMYERLYRTKSLWVPANDGKLKRTTILEEVVEKGEGSLLHFFW